MYFSKLLVEMDLRERLGNNSDKVLFFSTAPANKDGITLPFVLCLS